MYIQINNIYFKFNLILNMIVQKRFSTLILLIDEIIIVYYIYRQMEY